MTDHERVQILAGREIHDGLAVDEADELQLHLASCRSCRLFAAGIRRDEARLRAELVEAVVAPRVRRNVLDAAGGRRRTNLRLAAAVTAVLVIGIVGIPVLIGRINPGPGSSPSPILVSSPTAQTASPAQTAAPGGRLTGEFGLAFPFGCGGRLGRWRLQLLREAGRDTP